MQTTDRLISVKEASQILGIGKSTFWRWTKEGKLPEPVRLGPRTTRWRLSELQKIMDGETPTPVIQ